MASRKREVPAAVIGFKPSLAVAARRQLCPYQHVNAGPGRAYLCVGAQIVDNLLSPALDLAGLRIQAVVKIHTAEIIVWCEDKTYPVVALLTAFAGAHGLFIVGPSLRVSAAGSLACQRGVRYLGRLTAALLGTPAHPLSKVLYVLGVYYHVGILKSDGEHSLVLPASGLSSTISSATP